MVEYKKTPEDIKREKADLESNPVCLYLKRKEEMQFRPGDVLIKQYVCRNADGEDEWKVATHSSEAPIKFLYAFENDYGVGYIKQYLSNGSLSEVAIPVTELMDTYSRFALDPDFADHILIGEGKFDPLEIQRQKRNFRNRALAKNRKLLLPLKKPEDILAWVKTLKVGDTFYKGYSVSDLVDKQYRVAKIDHKKVLRDLGTSYRRDGAKRTFNITDNDIYPQLTLEVIKHPYSTKGYREECDPLTFNSQCVMTQEPYPLSEKL